MRLLTLALLFTVFSGCSNQTVDIPEYISVADVFYKEIKYNPDNDQTLTVSIKSHLSGHEVIQILDSQKRILPQVAACGIINEIQNSNDLFSIYEFEPKEQGRMLGGAGSVVINEKNKKIALKYYAP